METAHTIHATEQRLRPLTALSCAVVALADVWLLAQAWPLGTWQWASAGCCVLLMAMVARRALQGRLSIGMIPVAVFSLGFAGLAAKSPLPAAIGLAALAFFAVCFCRLAGAYAHAPQVEDGAALVVLGCSVRDGRPGATLRRRLEAALAAWHAHHDVTLVVTGGPAPGEELSEGEVMRLWLEEHGVPKSVILTDSSAVNTEQNLAFSSQLLDAVGHEGQRCVVSSDYHLWRVLRIARTLGLSPVPVPARTPLAGWLVQWSREVLVSLNWLCHEGRAERS